jgi:conserved oligomeric Golgi complex subunit 2
MSSSVFAELLTNNLRSTASDDSDTEDLSTLPFPVPLSRPTFSARDFDTESFLLTHAQFRTLDDLRAELRTWVDKLENEMEIVIEEDWQGYLSLGRRLAGGEGDVKDAERRIRAVEREVQGVRRRIEERIREFDGMMMEKLRIRENAVPLPLLDGAPAFLS